MRPKDAAKAALYTTIFTFGGAFVLALTGWLGDIVQWATSDGAAVRFPDPAILVKAGVAAVAGIAGGLVNFGWRLLQGWLGKGEVPTYVKAQKG